MRKEYVAMLLVATIGISLLVGFAIGTIYSWHINPRRIVIIGSVYELPTHIGISNVTIQIGVGYNGEQIVGETQTDDWGNFGIEVKLKTDLEYFWVNCVPRHGYFPIRMENRYPIPFESPTIVLQTFYWINSTLYHEITNHNSSLVTKTIKSNMTSTLFSKLDGSYVFWDLHIDPDVIEILATIEIFGGRGNNTQVTVIGGIPNRVDLTFFNGTNIAYTSYYPALQYWTEPEIVQGKL